LVEKIYHTSTKLLYFHTSKKRFKKFTMKIDILGTYPNFQLSPHIDFGPLGIKVLHMHNALFKVINIVWINPLKILLDQKLVVCCFGILEGKNNVLKIFSFGWVNYIFHKLSSNTKYIKIPASYELKVNFCSKWVLTLFFMCFLGSSYRWSCS
jgi:hypothetical protein